MKRRSDIHIIHDILKITLATKYDEYVVITRMQIKSHLSYNVFQKFLDKMIRKKLLDKDSLLPTKKGISFYKTAQKISKLEAKLNKNLS